MKMPLITELHFLRATFRSIKHGKEHTKMASIYYRGKAPAGCWWIQFYHPRTGELSRFSLCTGDRYGAEVIQRRVELEVELRRPELQLVQIPPPLTECLYQFLIGTRLLNWRRVVY